MFLPYASLPLGPLLTEALHLVYYANTQRGQNHSAVLQVVVRRGCQLCCKGVSGVRALYFTPLLLWSLKCVQRRGKGLLRLCGKPPLLSPSKRQDLRRLQCPHRLLRPFSMPWFRVCGGDCLCSSSPAPATLLWRNRCQNHGRFPQWCSHRLLTEEGGLSLKCSSLAPCVLPCSIALPRWQCSCQISPLCWRAHAHAAVAGNVNAAGADDARELVLPSASSGANVLPAAGAVCTHWQPRNAVPRALAEPQLLPSAIGEQRVGGIRALPPPPTPW